MKYLVCLIFILSFSNSIAQINYESGYIINNNGETVNCFIKNKGWIANPKEIDYKINQNDKVAITVDSESIKEFGIGDYLKYERHNVQIDRSSRSLKNISQQREPEYSNEMLFLKVLVEGRANLYHFEDNKIFRFFYNVDNAEVKQLIYKKYSIDNNLITTNATFRRQLFDDLTCNSINMADYQELEHDVKDLTNVFILYNECHNALVKNYEKIKKKGKFNLKVNGGLSQSSVKVIGEDGLFVVDVISTEFDTKSSIRFGVEAEYVLPFNKSKWAVFTGATYEKFSGVSPTKVEWQFQTFEDQGEIDYTFVEVPIGIRHYMYLNDNGNSKLFMNVAYVLVLDLGDSKIAYDERVLEINSGASFSFGLGYVYDKYSIEFRSTPKRNILTNGLISYKAEYTSVSLNLGYSIF